MGKNTEVNCHVDLQLSLLTKGLRALPGIFYLEVAQKYWIKPFLWWTFIFFDHKFEKIMAVKL